MSLDCIMFMKKKGLVLSFVGVLSFVLSIVEMSTFFLQERNDRKIQLSQFIPPTFPIC